MMPTQRRNADAVRRTETPLYGVCAETEQILAPNARARRRASAARFALRGADWGRVP